MWKFAANLTRMSVLLHQASKLAGLWDGVARAGVGLGEAAMHALPGAAEAAARVAPAAAEAPGFAHVLRKFMAAPLGEGLPAFLRGSRMGQGAARGAQMRLANGVARTTPVVGLSGATDFLPKFGSYDFDFDPEANGMNDTEDSESLAKIWPALARKIRVPTIGKSGGGNQTAGTDEEISTSIKPGF